MAELRRLRPLTPRPHLFSLQTSYAGHREQNLPVQMLNQFIGQMNSLIENVEAFANSNTPPTSNSDLKFTFDPPLKLNIPLFYRSEANVKRGSCSSEYIRTNSIMVSGLSRGGRYAGFPRAIGRPNGKHIGYEVGGREYSIGFKNGGHVKIRDGDFQIVEVGSTIYRGDQKHWIQISFGYGRETIKIRFNVFKKTRMGLRSVKQSIHIGKSRQDGVYRLVKGKAGLGFLKEFYKKLDRMVLNYGCIENAFLLDCYSPWGLLTLLRHAHSAAT